jgi:hypothetical protein
MNYDLDFRYRRALQPDGLATIPTATQAVVDALQDARNAGVDPARDPATILLARHRRPPGARPRSRTRPSPRTRRCAGSASPGSTS